MQVICSVEGHQAQATASKIKVHSHAIPHQIPYGKNQTTVVAAINLPIEIGTYRLVCLSVSLSA